MYAERSRSNGIWIAVTSAIARPRNVTRTWTVPYGLSTGSPSTVRVAPLVVVVGPDVFDPTPVPGGGAPVAGVVVRLGVIAPACLVAMLGDDLNDASAPRPIIVMTMAGTARR